MKKDTPTETYKLKGREVLVTRDDLIGDGKIFITSIDSVVRIRTGDKDEEAL